MPEKLSQRNTPPPPNNPNESANYGGDFGELFLERVKNPVIKKQIVRLIQEGGDKTTPTNIQRRINRGIEQAKRFPEIVPGTGHSGTRRIYRDNMTLIGRPMTLHEITMVAAHEKGHLIRPYSGKWFAEYFISGFDTSKVEFTEADYKEYLHNLAVSGFLVFDDEEDESDLGRRATQDEIEKMNPYEVAKDKYLSYLFSSMELTERMGQLKNYFGMKANEAFTAEHLKVARERYLVDLPGCDNGMTQFFQAITPETEERFLYLINNSGI